LDVATLFYYLGGELLIMDWIFSEGRKSKKVDITTQPENRGPFNPKYFNKREYMEALEEVARRNPADPFAVVRAKNLMDRGVYRPVDIKTGVSV
jgi:hypothetical protein